MGRELKRVPMDFDWPLKTIWTGFINGKHRPCPENNKRCFGGYTGARQWLESICRLLSLAAEQSVGIVSTDDFEKRTHDLAGKQTYPHPYLAGFPQAPTYGLEHERCAWHLVPPTKDLAELVSAITKQPAEFNRLGGNYAYKLELAIMEAAGMAQNWGICPVCEGHCVDPAVKAEYDAWERTEPPRGDGYQLWETTSEGSPQSPVFATLEELSAWCETNATTFGYNKTSAAEWKRMLAEDMVCHREGNMTFI